MKLNQLKMHSLPLLLLVLFFISIEVSAQPPTTLVAPIKKDADTSLYTLTLNSDEHYVIDINAPFLWYICQRPHPTVGCSAPTCTGGRTYLSSLCPPANNTFNKNGQCSCIVTPVNPVTNICGLAQLTYKDLVLSWTNGKNPTVNMDFNHIYVSCAPISLLKSLPRHAIGIAGLSWAPLALSSQLTPSYLELTKKFAICFPSTTRTPGPIFFGDGPYYFKPSNFDQLVDPSSGLFYTPMVKRNNSQEYYIGVKGISINGKSSKFGVDAFEFDSSGHGGVKLSTTVPYTTLRSDIYKIFLRDFLRASKGIPRANMTAKPFHLCVRTLGIGHIHGGLPVPQFELLPIPLIDLQLASGNNLTIYARNSMKQVAKKVACLAFVDGGKDAKEAAVIGSHQMEDVLLQFDLDASRLGFSLPLLSYGTTCGSFNFTAPA